MINYFAIIILSATVLTIFFFICFIIKWIKRKPKKLFGIATLVSFIVWFVTCGILSSTITEKGLAETNIYDYSLTNTAVFEDFTLVLNRADVEIAENGSQILRVNATYTNSSETPNYALSCFVVRAFQHNEEIPDVSDINSGEAALIQEINNGQSIEVSYVFALADLSDVEILVGEPTANQITIAKAFYNLTGQ